MHAKITHTCIFIFLFMIKNIRTHTHTHIHTYIVVEQPAHTVVAHTGIPHIARNCRVRVRVKFRVKNKG